MAIRAFYVKSTDIDILIYKLSSMLAGRVEKILLTGRIHINEFNPTINSPNRLIISKELVGDWIQIRYENNSILRGWGEIISRDLKTQIVVLHYLHDFGFGYFGFYDCGKRRREFSIQDIGDYPFIEEDWDHGTQTKKEARKDITIGIEMNEGNFPKIKEELSDSFDYLKKGISLINEYCGMLSINLEVDINELAMKIVTEAYDEYILLQNIDTSLVDNKKGKNDFPHLPF